MNPIAPAHNRTETQDLAFERGRAVIGTARQRILEAVRASGREGVTCARLEQALGMKHETAGPALNALRRRGLVRDSGQREQLADSGNEAILWIEGDGRPDPLLRPTAKERLGAALRALAALAQEAPQGPAREAAAQVLLAEGVWP